MKDTLINCCASSGSATSASRSKDPETQHEKDHQRRDLPRQAGLGRRYRVPCASKASGAHALKTAIVACGDANWMPAAAVALLSCARAGQALDSELLLCVHGATPDDAAALAAFNAKHNLAIQLIAADGTEFANLELGRFGIGAALRLISDRLLSPSFDRVLYLDSDILVMQPLAPLLNMDLEGHPIAAAPGVFMLKEITPRARALRAGIGLDEDEPYFNSGVLLFDWQMTLALGALPQASAMLHTRTWFFADQDVLNLVFRGRWKHLSYSWNVTDILASNTNIRARIKHFSGRYKPWLASRHRHHEKEHRHYRESLANTGWERFTEPGSPPWRVKETLLNLFCFKRKRYLRKLIKEP